MFYVSRVKISARIVPRVNKLCIFAGTVICSYGFWALGEWLGFSFFVNFLLSGVGSVAGVWLGWKVAQRFK